MLLSLSWNLLVDRGHRIVPSALSMTSLPPVSFAPGSRTWSKVCKESSAVFFWKYLHSGQMSLEQWDMCKVTDFRERKIGSRFCASQSTYCLACYVFYTYHKGLLVVCLAKYFLGFWDTIFSWNLPTWFWPNLHVCCLVSIWKGKQGHLTMHYWITVTSTASTLGLKEIESPHFPKFVESFVITEISPAYFKNTLHIFGILPTGEPLGEI